MDTIIIAIRFIWAIEEMRVPIMIVGTMFILGILVSIWSVHIPAKSLYKPYDNESTTRVSFKSMLHHFKKNPYQWLFYETEIYKIKDVSEMTVEENELLRKALARDENGGPYANKIGTRIILKNAAEGRKYLHFIESKASCPRSA